MFIFRFIKTFLATCVLAVLILFILSVVKGLVSVQRSVDVNRADIAVKTSGIRKNFKVALMSDSENDWVALEKALIEAKKREVTAVFFLGDLTTFGDLKSLKSGKKLLDDSGLKYYVIPGDHDLAASAGDGDSSGLAYFKQIFGSNYHSIELNNITFLLLDNSANYTEIEGEMIDWFRANLKDADFVILSQPIYHPTIARVMGEIDGKRTESVFKQGQLLLEAIRNSSVLAILASDHHVYSRSMDPIRKNLLHYVTGALTRENNFGSPEFLIMTIYEDKEFSVERVTSF